MSYYTVKRAFAPIAVQARRDIRDISILLSNYNAEPCYINIEVFHMNKNGEILMSQEKEIQYKTGDISFDAEKPIEVFRYKNLYDKIKERTKEIIYVSASVNGSLVADDMLFFCSFAEFKGEFNELPVKIKKIGDNKRQIRLETSVPVRMIKLESNQKLLFSDNYFPMVPGKSKIIEAKIIEKIAEEPTSLTIQILGFDKKQEFVL